MIKVTLRQKPISGGRKSLYLDYYPAIIGPDGEPTRREFLKLHIFDKPGNPAEKQHNKATAQMAEQIKLRRLNEVNKPEIYSAYEREAIRNKERANSCFYTFFEQQRERKRGATYQAWMNTLIHLKAFAGDELRAKDINARFCEDFREYLLRFANNKRFTGTRQISRNSAATYFNTFKAAVKLAHKAELLQTDISAKVAPIKPEEVRREFLAIEELNKLAATICQSRELKRAALFSALTGLRFSDIKKLTWQEVTQAGLLYTQQKTGNIETLPISNQARELLGNPGSPTDPVFNRINNGGHENKILARWMAAAGINKKITFHNFRHSFATLQLSVGTDIYTVSKLLGHRDLKHTQVYAKVLDKAKREAMDRIKLEL